MKRLLVLFVCSLFLLSTACFTGTHSNRLAPLSTWRGVGGEGFTILCVAAHPDDEDGAALAYYSKLKGYKAYTIFYTRGEGGQNEIGPELYDELGKIREQECYRAAEIQGSTPYFLGLLDFGYSKTAKETFKFWGGKDSVLERIVYMIRLIRPDVVITNHDTIITKPNRQHGNHQAAGITIYEAFDKAADPNYHPEQLVNGITPWQIKKLYFRVIDTTRTTNIFTLDVFQKDPATGKSIAELTFEALSQHRTQGMDKIDWKSIPEVALARRYELVRSDKMYPLEGDDLFEGLVPEDKGNVNVQPQSYPTHYAYKKVDPQDSLRILKSIKFSEGIKIGLVRSYDNTIEKVLKAFQIEFDTLSSNDLRDKDLSVYTTILLDIRAYLYREDLITNNNRILNYINDGGNVVCFYNKPGEWNGKNFSPDSIFLTLERVTEEDAKVKVLYPRHNFFNIPNGVTENDWFGWVQERNIYLPSDKWWQTSYKYWKVLAMQDEDDPVPSTSLLYGLYGKGTYTYCCLALYRQLRIFHEGALKLFMNMLSQPRDYNMHTIKGIR